MADDAIKTKIRQARFHLEKLRTPEHALAAESHFSALLACVRTVVMYVHEWQLTNGHAANVKDWARIQKWEASLPADQLAAWRALTELRNDDIHEEPVVPYAVRRGGLWGNMFGPNYWGNMFGGHVVRLVSHPKTGAALGIIEIAEGSISAVENLLAVYQSL